MVYLAILVCEMDHISDIPFGSAPSLSPGERKAILSHIANRIVDEVWLMPSTEELNEVLDAELPGKQYEWCFCGEGSHIWYESVLAGNA